MDDALNTGTQAPQQIEVIHTTQADEPLTRRDRYMLAILPVLMRTRPGELPQTLVIQAQAMAGWAMKEVEDHE